MRCSIGSEAYGRKAGVQEGKHAAPITKTKMFRVQAITPDDALGRGSEVLDLVRCHERGKAPEEHGVWGEWTETAIPPPLCNSARTWPRKIRDL